MVLTMEIGLGGGKGNLICAVEIHIAEVINRGECNYEKFRRN